MAITARRSPLGVLILTVLLGAPVILAAQSQAAGPAPNFSGTWIEDSVKPPVTDTSGNGAGLIGAIIAGKEVTIAQAKSLKVTRLQGGKELVFEIHLDGTPSGNIVTALGGPTKQMYRGTWVGERLQVTTTVSRNPDPIVTNQWFSLKDGNLVVETVTPSLKQVATYKRKRS